MGVFGTICYVFGGIFLVILFFTWWVPFVGISFLIMTVVAFVLGYVMKRKQRELDVSRQQRG